MDLRLLERLLQHSETAARRPETETQDDSDEEQTNPQFELTERMRSEMCKEAAGRPIKTGTP